MEAPTGVKNRTVVFGDVSTRFIRLTDGARLAEVDREDYVDRHAVLGTKSVHGFYVVLCPLCGGDLPNLGLKFSGKLAEVAETLREGGWSETGSCP